MDADLYDEADRYLTAMKKLDLLKTQLEQLHLKKLTAIKHQEFKAAQTLKIATEQIHRILEMDFDHFMDFMVKKKEPQ